MWQYFTLLLTKKEVGGAVVCMSGPPTPAFLNPLQSACHLETYLQFYTAFI